MKIGWRTIVWTLLALATGAESLRAETRPPNIILVMADDLGWTDVGCQGSTYYETPHIDRLAQQGMTFTSYYVCQNCAPTRAAMMSGQYAPRTGVYTVGTPERGRAKDRKLVPPPNATRLPLEIPTLADALRDAGYVTGMFGKWHLGTDKAYHPSQRGFDEAIVSNGRHFNFKTDPPADVKSGEYLADFLTDQSVKFIERHRDKPFFLYLPHFAVHTPIHAKDDLIARYRDKPPVGGHNNPKYAAMIHSVDESVGRIMARLDELRLAENTVLIFTSDNGGLGGYDVPGTKETKGITDNAPLRGGKGTLYEGGVRVPFIVRWPAEIAAATKCPQPIVHVDLLPTFCDLASHRLDATWQLDGVSFASQLREPAKPLSRHAIFWHMPGYLESYIKEATWRTTPVSVVRAGDYKLLEFYEGDQLELYNLEDDLGERQNLAAEMPDKTRELRDMLVAWRAKVVARVPRHKTEDELRQGDSKRGKKRRRQKRESAAN